MEIRLAVSGDFQAIRHYDSHIPSPRLADCIGSGQVYVLKDAGKIIGVLRYSLFWQTIPFLDLLYLDSRCRGQGHGRDMLAHWEAAMAKAGYAYVMLSTQEDETAKYFYEKLGYRLIGAFLPLSRRPGSFCTESSSRPVRMLPCAAEPPHTRIFPGCGWESPSPPRRRTQSPGTPPPGTDRNAFPRTGR